MTMPKFEEWQPNIQQLLGITTDIVANTKLLMITPKNTYVLEYHGLLVVVSEADYKEDKWTTRVYNAAVSFVSFMCHLTDIMKDIYRHEPDGTIAVILAVTLEKALTEKCVVQQAGDGTTLVSFGGFACPGANKESAIKSFMDCLMTMANVIMAIRTKHQ